MNGTTVYHFLSTTVVVQFVKGRRIETVTPFITLITSNSKLNNFATAFPNYLIVRNNLVFKRLRNV